MKNSKTPEYAFMCDYFPTAISAPVKAQLIGYYELLLLRRITVKHLWGDDALADR